MSYGAVERSRQLYGTSVASSDQKALNLHGLSVLVVAADFLIGLSITVYVKQMGASAHGPIERPIELTNFLTRFDRPDAVVVQVDPGQRVASSVQHALAANAIPLILIDEPMQWERSLLTQLSALKAPR